MQQPNESAQWALILGGSSGIGLATAHRLAQAGMNLCILHRDRRNQQTRLDKQWESLRQHSIQVATINRDALKVDTIESICHFLADQTDAVGKVHLLLHAISKGNLKPLLADLNQPVLEETDFKLTHHAMATSIWQWAQAMIKAQLFTPKARIIGLTSEGQHKTWPGYGAVAAAKASLEAIIRQMAMELAPLGLRANAIQAGITDTPSLRMIPQATQLLSYAQQRSLYGRITQPEDVANVIYLLTRPEADWINGTTLIVDGGEHLR